MPEPTPDNSSTIPEQDRPQAADSPSDPLAIHSAETLNLPGPVGHGVVSIPGYEILSELGRGGMGVVYKARQVSLNRIVALKMLRDSVIADGPRLARFRQEARAVARLQHPNIVHIYETGEHQNQPYFSMELIEGGNLKERLGGRPLPVQHAAQLIEVLARAIHHAHGRSIVHRDLKPSNILLHNVGQARGALGTPKISDFGLVKCLDGEGSLTPTGYPIGTASYMSPEQAEGDRRTGPRSDVYSLGAILYELVTGRPPFMGESWFDIIDQVRSKEPPLPTQLRPRLDHAVETICLKCLEKNPDDRYTSAEALAVDLRAFLEGKPIAARASRSFGWAQRAGFEVIRDLGRGDRLIYYLARHIREDKLVTLKVIAPGTEHDKLAELRAEAEVMGRLEHANIPRFFGLGAEDGHRFLAIEFIEGVGLDRHLGTPATSPAAAARLLKTLARAVQHAHEREIVHPDLRPPNIILTRDGGPRIMNFGLPTSPAERNNLSVRSLLTMLRYTAPEQTDDDAHISTPATNIYALGSILYEILTGRPPFEMVSLYRGMEQLLNQPPPPPSHYAELVPAGLDAICLRCLAKTETERYPTAEALAHDLQRFLES